MSRLIRILFTHAAASLDSRSVHWVPRQTHRKLISNLRSVWSHVNACPVQLFPLTFLIKYYFYGLFNHELYHVKSWWATHSCLSSLCSSISGNVQPEHAFNPLAVALCFLNTVKWRDSENRWAPHRAHRSPTAELFLAFLFLMTPLHCFARQQTVWLQSAWCWGLFLGSSTRGSGCSVGRTINIKFEFKSQFYLVATVESFMLVF